MSSHPAPAPVLDRFGRPLGSLRLSVTDRCNLRCQYCMPEEEYVWLPRKDLLSFDETAFVVERFAALGVRKLRITGGEPLIRRHLPELVRLVSVVPGIEDVALTTNGILLAGQAAALKEAGLHRITVSLDTLRPDRFRSLTRRDGLDAVQEGIAAANAAGLRPLKLDTVVIRGFNDDELVDLFEFASDQRGEIRFIEYMDVGGGDRLAPGPGVRCERHPRSHGEALRRRRSGPGGGPHRAGPPLPDSRWTGLWHHRLRFRTLLPRLRPQPRHRGRAVVPVSLCPRGARSQGPAPGRSDRRRDGGADRFHLVRPGRPRRRGAGGPGPARPARRRGGTPQGSRTSRCTPAGGNPRRAVSLRTPPVRQNGATAWNADLRSARAALCAAHGVTLSRGVVPVRRRPDQTGYSGNGVPQG